MTDALFDPMPEGEALYDAIGDTLADKIGWKLFTLMAIDWEAGEAARIYTSHPQDYPVGGRKPLGDMTDWGRIVLEQQQPWIARDMDDIRGAFFDHALIEALGCASCLNVPVVDPDAPQGREVIGTVNLLDEAGHFTPAHIEAVRPYAALLVPSYRAWAS